MRPAADIFWSDYTAFQTAYQQEQSCKMKILSKRSLTVIYFSEVGGYVTQNYKEFLQI